MVAKTSVASWGKLLLDRSVRVACGSTHIRIKTDS
jgi:hypothetical protein